jgi:hypothetical protein
MFLNCRPFTSRIDPRDYSIINGSAVVSFRGTRSALNADVTADLAIVGVHAEKVDRYLKSLLRKDVTLWSMTHLGEPLSEVLGKSYGYGATHPRRRSRSQWTQVNEYCGA